MTNPKFQDERVRRAFALGLDFVEWDLARYNGEAGPGGFVQSPIPWPYLHETRPTLEALRAVVPVRLGAGAAAAAGSRLQRVQSHRR